MLYDVIALGYAALLAKNRNTSGRIIGHISPWSPFTSLY